MKISIAYAIPGRQMLQSFEVAEGTTIQMAIADSGILEQLPQLDLRQRKIGIFGKLKAPETVLADGDRIEIYRAVTTDPKKVPRRRNTDKTAD